LLPIIFAITDPLQTQQQSLVVTYMHTGLKGESKDANISQANAVTHLSVVVRVL